MNQAEAIAGALLGTAAGDVFGSVIEGADAVTAAAMVASGALPGAGARYSDDTQQALVIAYHLLHNGGVDPAALAAEFSAVADLMRGAGPGFLAFVSRFRSGAPHGEAAQQTAGNGAAMRSAPPAMWCHRRPETLIDTAFAAATVTHADPRGVAAGVALPAAVMGAAAGVEGPDLVRDAADHAAEAEHRVLRDAGIRSFPGDISHTLSLALRAAAPLVGSHPVAIAAAVGKRAAVSSASGSASGTHPYAVASVVTAITIAAGGADDPAAVEGAVALGGDTDTVGAMVGAIIGARRGTSVWPWPVPNSDLLVEVGTRLATGGDDRGLPDLSDAVVR